MSSSLASQKCLACTIGTPPLTSEEIETYMYQLRANWEVIENKKIQKEFEFKDFLNAIEFINAVAKIAESESHHPNIILHDYKKVRIELWTHKINGLAQADFVLAAKIEQIFEKKFKKPTV